MSPREFIILADIGSLDSSATVCLHKDFTFAFIANSYFNRGKLEKVNVGFILRYCMKSHYANVKPLTFSVKHTSKCQGMKLTAPYTLFVAFMPIKAFLFKVET